jgi:hypothetical protein
MYVLFKYIIKLRNNYVVLELFIPESLPLLEPDDFLPDATSTRSNDNHTEALQAENTPHDIQLTELNTQTVNEDAVTLVAPISDLHDLDTEALTILGDDPLSEIKYGKDIRTELASRLQHIAQEGLSKDARKILISKYPLPSLRSS